MMKLLSGLTLGKKIALMAGIGLLVGMGIFSFLAIRAVSQSVDTMLQDRLTLARLTADYIDDTLSHVLTEVADVASTIDPNKGDPGQDMDQMEAIASRLSIEVSGIYIARSDGSIAWAKPAVQGYGPISFSSYSTVKQSLSDGITSVSGLVASPFTGVPVVLLTAASPPNAEGTRDALVVAVDVGKSSIAGLVQPVKLGQTGYVEIVDQNGVVVARTQPGPQPAPFEISDHSGKFAALINAGEVMRGVCHSCHEPGYAVQSRDVLAFAPLSEANWGVVIRQSESEALTPIRELRQNLILAGLGVFIVAAISMTLMTRDVVGRIHMLTSASKRIAQGDLVTPISPVRHDELGVLAHTLDEMRTKLHASYQELAQRTNELSVLLGVSESLALVPSLAGLENALDQALERTMQITKADGVGVLLWNQETGVYSYHAHRGLSERYTSAMSCKPGEGIIGKVAETGEPIQVEDITTDPRAVRTDLLVAEGLKGFAAVPLKSKHSLEGVLVVASHEAHQLSSHDLRLLESIGGQIGTAVENVRLQQEVQRKDEMRRELLREVLSMQEEDRRRIARELHDETSQVIASLTANLEAIVSVLPSDGKKAVSLARKTQGLSVKILDEIHRLIYELRPSLLDDMGLVSAARWLGENNLEAGGIGFEFRTVGKTRRLPSEVEVTLFRVIQEAMNNILRHAGAKKASVVLYFRKSSISVRIADDGQGFDVQEAINAKDRPRGLGLLGMRERVELLKGTINIRSKPGESGTVVEVKIPVEEGYDGQNQSTRGR